MKNISIFIISISSIIGASYFLFGSTVTLAILGALSLSAIIIISGALGSWWTKRVMESGAQIALIAQTSDDKRDIAQLNGISSLLREGVKLGREQSRIEQPQYPALTNGGGVTEGEFRIDGFDE